MQREFSAGGVLVRRLGGRWMLGQIEQGEAAEATALREVAEETGAHGRSLGKLGDVKYVYTWPPKPAEGERIFKVVSFFLIRYEGGRLGDVPEEFQHEVAEVKWLPLDEAPRLLAYGGEKEMARKALERLSSEDV
jgi:8-oxo-dGTP pyrophosphatase MutT (NUDIX family)